MKRALVLTLLVVGLGVFAFAGPLTGEWDTNFCFDVDQSGSITVTDLTSTLDIDYEVCGWTFGSSMVFTYADGFNDIDFTVAGALGAFQFGALVDFDPTAAAIDLDGFVQLEAYVDISIAGVELYGFFALEDGVGDAANASAFAVGGFGTVGACTLYMEVDFGLTSEIWSVYYYGVAGAWVRGLAADATCDVAWTGIDIIAEFPFACVDVTADLGFSCANGFDGINFTLANIDLGLGWLQVDELVIGFENDSKTVGITLGLITLDTVCVTPYISVMGSEYQFTGISVDALELSYSWNGVTFLASEIFANMHYYKLCDPTLKAGAFTAESANTANEVIGVEIDGDSCCGGSFDAYAYNFFTFNNVLTDPGTLFDWHHTCVGLSYGISSNVTLDASLVVLADGLQQMCFGFNFVW